MLQCISSVVDHSWRQSVVRTKKWRSAPCGLDVTISASCDWPVAIFITSLESQESYLTLRNVTLHITGDFFRQHSTFASSLGWLVGNNKKTAPPFFFIESGRETSFFFTWPKSQFRGGMKPECPEKTLEVRLRSTETQSTYNIVVGVEGVIDVHCASLTFQGV